MTSLGPSQGNHDSPWGPPLPAYPSRKALELHAVTVTRSGGSCRGRDPAGGRLWAQLRAGLQEWAHSQPEGVLFAPFPTFLISLDFCLISWLREHQGCLNSSWGFGPSVQLGKEQKLLTASRAQRSSSHAPHFPPLLSAFFTKMPSLP